jgi:hypothetical protein
VTIAGLAITQGLTASDAVHPGMGGGILLVSGSLTLSQVILLDNRAVRGSGGSGLGGGIYNLRNLKVPTRPWLEIGRRRPIRISFHLADQNDKKG